MHTKSYGSWLFEKTNNVSWPLHSITFHTILQGVIIRETVCLLHAELGHTPYRKSLKDCTVRDVWTAVGNSWILASIITDLNVCDCYLWEDARKGFMCAVHVPCRKWSMELVEKFLLFQNYLSYLPGNIFRRYKVSLEAKHVSWISGNTWLCLMEYFSYAVVCPQHLQFSGHK